MIGYVALTAFESPQWCNKINNCVFPLNPDGKIDKEKPQCAQYRQNIEVFENWDPNYCNNPEQIFTNSNTQKLP